MVFSAQDIMFISTENLQ